MRLALSGIRVLDLGEYLAGPFCSTILGDLGAEVIKVSAVGRKSSVSIFTQPILGQDPYYFSVNRNKKSVLLDLKSPEGQAIFHNLVKRSHVVVDNFRPGVTEKLRIDYPTLRQLNPRIVYCSITGYGSTGPYAHLPAFDGAIQAIAGIMSLTGESGGRPLVAGIPIVDYATPMFAAHGILAALLDVERFGEGQSIEISLLGSAMNLLHLQASDYFASGKLPEPAGAGANVSATSGVYDTLKTKDGYIFVAAHRKFNELCTALGRDDLLNDPRFSSQAKQIENRDLLRQVIQEIFLDKETADLAAVLWAHGVPCGPVNNLAQAFQDPQIAHLGILVSQSKGGRDLKVIRGPFRMPGAREELEPAALPGENTDEVLSELLEYSPEEIQQFRHNGVIA